MLTSWVINALWLLVVITENYGVPVNSFLAEVVKGLLNRTVYK